MIALLLIGGIILLYLGAECLIRGASRLAIGIGIPVLVVSLTIVSMGTSLPELVASLIAQVKEGRGDIALANVIGSNIANIGLILGVTTLVHPLTFSSHVSKTDTPIMIATAIALVLFMLPGSINRIFGAILFIAMIVYIFYRVKVGELSTEEEELAKLQPKAESYWTDLFLILLGLILLVLGGDSFVKGAVQMAKTFGISDRVIGLTIVAIGTSLPEFATTFLAAIRKHSDIAIGNIVGSTILNSLFIVGGIAIIKPIHFSENLLWIDGPVMLFFSAMLWLMMRQHHSITRLQGLILLVCYVIYVVCLIVKPLSVVP